MPAGFVVHGECRDSIFQFKVSYAISSDKPFNLAQITCCSLWSGKTPTRRYFSCLKIGNLRLFQFLVWNCLKSIFGQIPEIHKNTKRNNCQYPGDRTNCVKPVFSPDSRCSYDAMRCHPQYSPGNHPYPGEIRIDQIWKKFQNCNAENNPQRHLYNADKNIQTKPFPFFLPYFQK